MTNPWLEWWEAAQVRWSIVDSPAVLRQLAVLGAALALAFLVDRLLERSKERWLGAPLEKHKLRAVLWAAKFPVLALLFGYLALSIYDAVGRPTYTLHKLVTFFWFVAAYALAAKAVTVWMSAGGSRRIIRRALLPTLIVVGLLHLSGLLSALWTWAAQPVVTWASGDFTLANVAMALLIAVVSWIVARVGKALFLRRVLPRTETDPNLAYSVATFVQFSIIVVGLWISMLTLGLSLSNLTLLVTALTVGIGFGLQDVIKNVMGGMILLGEGHVRPNEVFKIGDDTGIIEAIGLRSTTLRAVDGSIVIIPNADLISNKVTDLTKSLRVAVTVGVSCDADPRLAERLLLEIAADHPEVLAEPAPSVFFHRLGESTLDLTLYCFVDDRSKVVSTQSDLHYSIVETFNQHDLELPYRQLDVHLRSRAWQ